MQKQFDPQDIIPNLTTISTMTKKTASEVSALQKAYQSTNFSVMTLQDNIEEAYFDRQGVIEFLNSLQTQYVKVALALSPLDATQITMIMLGVSAQGIPQNCSDGLISDIPCPPQCREQSVKAKIIISV